MAGAGTSLWYRFSPGRWRSALENYAAVLARPATDPEVARVARAAQHNYGEVLADFLLSPSVTREEVLERVSVQGIEHLDRALAAGRGCIMAVPHMGSWDMAACYAGAVGYRVAAVTERMPGSLDEVVVATRRSLGVRVISLSRTAGRAILAELRAGAIVALLCDLPHGPGVKVEMFGRQVTVPPGPAAFACRVGSPLLPTYVYRTGPGTYQAVVEPPISTAGFCDGKDAQQALMQEITRHFERAIRAHPESWFAFQKLE